MKTRKEIKCTCKEYAMCFRCVKMLLDHQWEDRKRLTKKVIKLEPGFARIMREDVLDILDNKKI